MAASSNESFGLKIATALSIALTVVLLVLVYFLNSNYNSELEAKNKAVVDLGNANKSVRDFQSQANYYREAVGYAALEDFEPAKAQMKKDQDAIKVDIQAINTEVAAMVTEFQKKAEAKGVDVSQFDPIKQRAAELVDNYMNLPDQSYKASLVRLKDLTVNQARLTTALALNYVDIRKDLDLANTVNATASDVLRKGYDAAKAELDETIKKDEEARTVLVATTQKQSGDLAALETKLTNIVNDMTGKVEKRDKTINQLTSVVRDIRDLASQKEDVMKKPGGRVTYVDPATRTVRVSVNRAQGVRPLMRFTIFDQNAAGLVSDKPKAAVELIKIGDPQRGENDSLARIVKTFNDAEPIRYNDYIYSVGWSYDHPQRFDLIGKIDINRDGKDDRGDLIRMIEASGGVVEFDLPPPNTDRGPGQAAVGRAFARFNEPVPASTGRAAGKISGLSYAYVTDTRSSTVVFARKSAEPTKEDTQFLQAESEATKEARDNGVRPLPLEKLLNMLGYDYSAPVEGRREAANKGAIQELLKAKAAEPARRTPAPAAADPAATPEPK